MGCRVYALGSSGLGYGALHGEGGREGGREREIHIYIYIHREIYGDVSGVYRDRDMLGCGVVGCSVYRAGR